VPADEQVGEGCLALLPRPQAAVSGAAGASRPPRRSPRPSSRRAFKSGPSAPKTCTTGSQPPRGRSPRAPVAHHSSCDHELGTVFQAQMTWVSARISTSRTVAATVPAASGGGAQGGTPTVTARVETPARHSFGELDRPPATLTLVPSARVEQVHAGAAENAATNVLARPVVEVLGGPPAGARRGP